MAANVIVKSTFFDRQQVVSGFFNSHLLPNIAEGEREGGREGGS